MRLQPLPKDVNTSKRKFVPYKPVERIDRNETALLQPLQFYMDLANKEKLGKRRKRRAPLVLYMTRAEKQLLADYAASKGKTLSEYIRTTILEAAINEAKQLK